MMLLRRHITANLHLPYFNINAVSNQGQSYINTRVLFHSNLLLYIEFELNSYPKFGYVPLLYSFYNSGAYISFWINNTSIVTSYDNKLKETTINHKLKLHEKYIVYIKDNAWYLTNNNDTILLNYIPSNTFSEGGSSLIYLLCCKSDPVIRFIDATIYNFKIYEDKILTRNYIQVINYHNNRVCLYDKINDKFYYSENPNYEFTLV